MIDLLDSASRRLPHEVRVRARRGALLNCAGWSDAEAADRLGITTRTLRRDRETLRGAILDVMREDGYSDREIAVALGLPNPVSTLAA